jgi:oligopeptidase B
MKDHISVWHGESVNDPWFWLREKDNPEVLAYLQAENAFTESQATAITRFGDVLYAEILGRIKQTDSSVPIRRDAWFYFSRTDEGRQYPVHSRRAAGVDGTDDPRAQEQVLLDLNQLAEGHAYFSLGVFAVSDDGGLLLYSTDTTGFRQYTLYLKDLGTGTVSAALAERVTSAQWMADGRHFVYTTEDATTKRSNAMWRRDLQASTATLLYEELDELYSIGLWRTRDRTLLVCVVQSTDTWEARILRSDEVSGQFAAVLPREKGHKYSVDHREGLLYLRTNRQAKNFRLVSAPLTEPSAWTEVVPHSTDTLLDGIELFAGHLVVQEQRDALVRYRIYGFADHQWTEVGFPESVYAASSMTTPEWNAAAFRISYQSMVTPPTVYDVRLADGALTLLKRNEVLGGYDAGAYATERRWATARDGTRIPLSLFYKKGTPLDAGQPCLLYGYGSYGFGMSAAFSHANISLVDRGVIYVLAHIRGGNDLGEAWHDQGMLLAKKNTFFDFIDAAVSLVETRLTTSDRLMIQGHSAGGLLVGAVTNERPDLFGAVHAAVPFVDVLNTMFDASLPLTVGEYLEWGDPHDKIFFDYMRSYSPYDNVAKTAYPAMLVTTSLNDSQVMYWEPAKWVARLRHYNTGARPLHFKCNMGAGHGGASGRYDRLKEVAFEYAWLLSQAGITA